MATDIVQTLFGITPEGYQQQQSALADARALQFAQLDPMQQATYGIYRGAGQLGGALGRALGGEDPELTKISLRQSLSRQINFNDPTSIQEGVRALSQAGDTQGAMMLAETARKAASESALMVQRNAAAAASLAQANRERQQAIPADILKAREIDRLKRQRDLLASSGGEAQEIAYVDAQLAELRNLKEVNGSLVDAAGNVVYSGQPKLPSVGTDREAVALATFNAPFAQLTPEQRAQVNTTVETMAREKARAGASSLVLPGDKALVDIPAFRAKVQATIEPQSKAVFAADNALTAIEDSLKTNNFVSFNAARVQLAKALGDSQLSRRDVEQAGGDPSILGRLTDVTSTLFTGTPTVDTQNKIKQTLEAIRKVSASKATQEIDRQRKIALQSPGYSAQAVDVALDFPEFAPRPAAGRTSAKVTPDDQALLDKYAPAPRKP